MSARIPLTYCSFATDERCLGVVVLDGAVDPMFASLACHMAGLNPGGQLLAIILPDDLPEREYLQCSENRGRLLSPAEARELLSGKSIREHEEDDAREAEAAR